MFDIPLHVGTEHPDLLVVAVPGLLTFAAGLAAGLYSTGRDGRGDRTPETVTDADE